MITSVPRPSRYQRQIAAFRGRRRARRRAADRAAPRRPQPDSRSWSAPTMRPADRSHFASVSPSVGNFHRNRGKRRVVVRLRPRHQSPAGQGFVVPVICLRGLRMLVPTLLAASASRVAAAPAVSRSWRPSGSIVVMRMTIPATLTRSIAKPPRTPAATPASTTTPTGPPRAATPDATSIAPPPAVTPRAMPSNASTPAPSPARRRPACRTAALASMRARRRRQLLPS